MFFSYLFRTCLCDWIDKFNTLGFLNLCTLLLLSSAQGVKFQNLVDAGDPAKQAELYEKEGADEITLLDISATPEGRNTAIKVLPQINFCMDTGYAWCRLGSISLF